MSATAAVPAGSEPVRIADAIEDALARIMAGLREERRLEVMAILHREEARNG